MEVQHVLGHATAVALLTAQARDGVSRAPCPGGNPARPGFPPELCLTAKGQQLQRGGVGGCCGSDSDPDLDLWPQSELQQLHVPLPLYFVH